MTTSSKLKVSGTLIILISVMTLIGWTFDFPLLVRLHSSLPAMKINTAVCFILCGLNLILLGKQFVILIRCSAIFIVMIGLFTWAEYILGIDSFFIISQTNIPNPYSERMSLNAGSNFLLVGIAFMLCTLTKHLSRAIRMTLALISCLIIFFAITPIFFHLAGLQQISTLGDFSYMALHTIFCFILIAVNLLGYTQFLSGSKSRILPIATFLCMLLCTLSLSYAVKFQEEDNFRNLIKTDAINAANQMYQYQITMYKAIDRLRQRWEVAGGTPHYLWESDVSAYLVDFPPLRSISYAGTDLKLKWILPAKYNSMAGYYLKKDKERARTVEQVVMQKKPQTSHIVSWLVGGGNGYIYMDPLIIKGKFCGLFSVSIDLNKLMAFLFKDSLFKNYDITLFENDLKIFSTITKTNLFAKKISQAIEINVNDFHWRFVLTPKPLLLTQQNSFIPVWILIIGFFFSLVSSLAFYFSIKSNENSKDLKKIKENLQSILDASYHAIISTDINGNIQLFNKAAEKMLGYRAEDLINKETPILFHDPAEIAARSLELSIEFNQKVKPGLDTFTKNVYEKDLDEHEWTMIRKNGKRFPIWLSTTGLKNVDKEIVGFVGIAQDISERKALDALKAEFISVVSHELRTPLTSINGSISLILSGVLGELNQKILDLLKIANNNSNRLIHLINDLLDLEKMQAGKLSFHLTEVNLNDLAKSAVDENKAYADKYSINLLFQPLESQLFLKTDEGRLMQVLANLISNAIKFSPKGRNVTLKLTTKDRCAVMSVIDEGQGISESFKTKIFERFSQADSGSNRSQGGTGLGLSITKTIVEQLGGNIYFKSELGAGTTFWIELPYSTDR